MQRLRHNKIWLHKAKKTTIFLSKLNLQKEEFYPRLFLQGLPLNIKNKIIDMAINGSGINDTIRVLKIAKNTVLTTIREKSKSLVQVNPSLLFSPQNEAREVRFEKASLEAEVDEQWSYVKNKSNQRWLWYAIDHTTNTILACVLGKRKDDVFKKLKEKLSSFNITKFYTDNWGEYERNSDEKEH